MKNKNKCSEHHCFSNEAPLIQATCHKIINELISTVSTQHDRYLNATQESIEGKFRFILNVLKTIGITDLRSDVLALTVKDHHDEHIIKDHHIHYQKAIKPKLDKTHQSIICSWIMLTMAAIQVEGKLTKIKMINALTRIESYSLILDNQIFTLTLNLPKMRSALYFFFQEEKNIDDFLLQAFLVLMDLTARKLMPKINHNLRIKCDYFTFTSILDKKKQKEPATATIACTEIKEKLNIIIRSFFEKLIKHAEKTKHLELIISNKIISIMLPKTHQDLKLMSNIIIESYRNELQTIIDNEIFDNVHSQLQKIIKVIKTFLPWSLGAAELCQESLLLAHAKTEMHHENYNEAFNSAITMFNFYMNSKIVNKGYLFQAYGIAVEAATSIQNFKLHIPILHRLFHLIPLDFKTHNGELTKTYCQLKLAYCYRLLGEYQLSNQLLIEAIEVSKRENDPLSHCKSLVQRSEYDLMFQRYSHAYKNLNLALELSSTILHKPTKSLIYDRLGCLFKETECFEAALSYINKSIELAPESTNWNDSQAATINLASLHFQMREYQITAKILYNIMHHEKYDRINKEEKFRANKLLGACCLKLNDYPQAKIHYNQALQLINSNISTENKANVYARLAQVYLQQNDLQNSIFYCKKSLLLLNGTWRKLKNDDQRITFSDHYNLTWKILQQIYWLQSDKTKALNMAEAQRTRAFKYQLVCKNPDLNFLLHSRKHYIALASRFNTCFVFYSENPNRQMHIWVITSRSIETATTCIDQSVIESIVSTINSLCSDSDSTKQSTCSVIKPNLIDLLKKAYQSIILPIEQMIINEPDLTIIPSINLHGFPFSALYNSDGTPLIEHHRIRTISSLSMFAMLYKRYLKRYQPARRTHVLLVSCKKTTEHKDPLPHSNQETTNIASFFQKNAPGLKCTHLSDKEATIAKVSDALINNDVIHFATHGQSEGPLLSNGILSQDMISPMALPYLQSIIFSMCNSLQPRGFLIPSGKDTDKKCRISFSRSDGINSIARSFLIAGAHTTFTTLFPVQDKFCLIFMNLFYKILLRIGNGNASLALQLTIKTIRKQKNIKDKGGSTVKHKDDLTHLWAPFLVYGLGLIPFYDKTISPSPINKRKRVNNTVSTSSIKSRVTNTKKHSVPSAIASQNNLSHQLEPTVLKRTKH